MRTSAAERRRINQQLEHAAAERMGELYEDLHALLWEAALDDGHLKYQLGALVRLVQQYGAENVNWMLRVLEEDWAQ